MSIVARIPDTPLDKQDIYNLVHRYFSAPGAKLAFDVNAGECLYRVYDEDEHRTRCCAFGCLIPDDLYQDGMEGKPWENVVEEDYTLEGLIAIDKKGVKEFMSEVQSLHDSCASENLEDTDTFLAYLDVLALAHSLRRETRRPALTTPPPVSYVKAEKVDVTLLARHQMPARIEAAISEIARNAEQAAFAAICEELADYTGGTVFGDMPPEAAVQIDKVFQLLVRTMAVNAESLQKYDLD